MPQLILALLIITSSCIVKEEKTYIAKKQPDPVGTQGPDWLMVQKLTDFTYPWQDEIPPPTIFQAVWDDHKFYFRFEVADNNILTYHDTDHKEEVVYSDRAEIFFKKDDDMSPYFCLEMDAAGRVLDYEAHYYRKVDFKWEWPDNGLSVSSTRSPTGYIVEGDISLSSLKRLGILDGNRMQAGLFRGECVSLKGKEADLKWISWVHPGTSKPDFHVPSAFGIIELAE